MKKYLPYEVLHKKWQYHLFEMPKEHVPTKKMRVKIDELYSRYPNRLVANVQSDEVSKRIEELARYLAQYVVSPPISVRRIVSYDGQRVKYWYDGHKSRDVRWRSLIFLLLLVGWCSTFCQRVCSGFGIMGFTRQLFITRFARSWGPFYHRMPHSVERHFIPGFKL